MFEFIMTTPEDDLLDRSTTSTDFSGTVANNLQPQVTHAIKKEAIRNPIRRLKADQTSSKRQQLTNFKDYFQSPVET